MNDYHATGKVLDTFSIFQYQTTVFYAQYVQINTPASEGKLTGLNMWFIIEILSFYGYILSAIYYIAES